jgi:hypothetical protein
MDSRSGRENHAVGYVVSLNLHRRHLSESQRAMVAAKLATLERGDNQHSPIGETSQAKAAELLNVGKRSVERARAVLNSGTAELIHAVEASKVKVSVAADIATLPADKQREIVSRCDPKIILEESVKVRAERARIRRAERDAKLISLSYAPFPKDRKYPIILADPPATGG